MTTPDVRIRCDKCSNDFPYPFPTSLYTKQLALNAVKKTFAILEPTQLYKRCTSHIMA